MSSYRKRFPKGDDWKEPKKNPYGFCGLHPSSYHSMKTVGVTTEKHEEAQKEINRLQILWAKQSDEIRALNKENQDINNALSKCVTFLNQELQNGNERVKLVLNDIGVLDD